MTTLPIPKGEVLKRVGILEIVGLLSETGSVQQWRNARNWESWSTRDTLAAAVAVALSSQPRMSEGEEF